MNIDDKLASLHGPVLIIGASGFVGANLLRRCLGCREDVVGTVFSGDSWRINEIPAVHIAFLNLQDAVSVQSTFQRVRPKTIFDCSSFGAYSFEQEIDRIHSTNYLSFIRVMEQVADLDVSAYIHAGSSSEYGLNASAPAETAMLVPNSHYAVSKAATSHAITYYGKTRGVPVVNLRLYSVYGPFEDSSRLIPVLCERSLHGELPIFARAEVTRDFIHIDDVITAFADAALRMSPELAGESLNIGTGIPTSLLALATLAKQLFAVPAEPQFTPSAGRAWDVDHWYANPQRARDLLGWTAKIGLHEGLVNTRDWWQRYLATADFSRLTKKEQPTRQKNSVAAIVACYRDAQAIPIMYERLIAVFNRVGLDYEIIFVNDCSPDESAEVIRQISAHDPHVIGVTHTRNFGSQSAFRSGMELATKEACVLLDGDLQDPPELIASFVDEWRKGADVIYGRRIKREMPMLLEVFYRGFYWLFAALSEVPMPKDAGDFSLMDRSVVYWILQCQERDAFLRGLRAYVGFKQVGVDYARPERMFGVSTNNWAKNIGWAKKGIFSFSRAPLNMLTALGTIASIATVGLALYAILLRVLAPESVPKGITFLSLLVMFFGSFTILGIGLLGEYIGKIMEETKARPAFIRHSIIVRGEVRPAEHRRLR
ncbi:NAD-dependent epimerase/dehydratase family protein [uncultured Thiodictyon sp.]|uniref:NAD-dependent epimerase/dehydratase family protein n=1 Tax=uncultured Thiodictyon sp. TaxID=1846217 RepID=UPI0025EFF9CE|nr:NAD-dependent epimerase/dehydratase family protein [uncultured Thiodictyon sp.]